MQITCLIPEFKWTFRKTRRRALHGCPRPRSPMQMQEGIQDLVKHWNVLFPSFILTEDRNVLWLKYLRSPTDSHLTQTGDCLSLFNSSYSVKRFPLSGFSYFSATILVLSHPSSDCMWLKAFLCVKSLSTEFNLKILDTLMISLLNWGNESIKEEKIKTVSCPHNEM